MKRKNSTEALPNSQGADNSAVETDGEDTSKKIKRAATELFASKGFDRTSIKDITTQANVNIAAINYHFGSKERLLEEIIGDYAQVNYESAKRTLKKADSKEELKLRFEIALDEVFEIGYEYRDSVKIVQREIFLIKSLSKDIVRGTMTELVNIFVDFFESAKAKKLIRQDIDSSQLTLLIYSYVSTLTANDTWTLFDQFKGRDISVLDFREHAIKSLVDLLFLGISEEKKESE